MKNKILVSPSSFAEYSAKPLEELSAAGFEAVINPYKRRLKPEEVIALGKDCVGIIAGVEELNGKVLSELKDLCVISRVGTGIENIALQAAKERGIIIRNTPDAPRQSVAELTVGLIIGLIRNIPLEDRLLREGRWEKRMGRLLSGKSMGIIGIGRIGKRVAELLGPMDVDIAAYDLAPDLKWAQTHKVKILPLKDLLAVSDIITLHISSNGLILGYNEFAMIKKGAYLVNISRGEVIDEAALYDALKEGRLSGAALDVFVDEPYKGPLSTLDNVILTPHIGSYAMEARIAMELEATRNLIKEMKKQDNNPAKA